MSNRKATPEPSAGPEISAPISRHKQRGRPFGSGNPGRPFPPGHSGRPKGARNKATTVLRAMFEGEAERIGRRTVELAQEGRIGAIRLILDRACPARAGRTVEGFTLPPIATAADTVKAMSAIAAAVSDGTLSLDEARDLTALVETFRRTIELSDIAQAITEIESSLAEMREQKVRWE